MLKVVPPDKIIMGIANYGYDWPAKTKKDPHPVAQAVSFQEGVVTAVESESDITYDPDTFNLHYSYEDENNHVHTVWMLDGVTAYNELRATERAGVHGTAMWRLGTEDPSIWDIWDATHADDATRAKLQEVPAGYDIFKKATEISGASPRRRQSGSERSITIRQATQSTTKVSELSAFVADPGTGSGAKKGRAHV